jgi:type I restriction enzyme R subunit
MTPLDFNDMDTLVKCLMTDMDYRYIDGVELSPGGNGAAPRKSFNETVLHGILEDAVHRLNPGVPAGVRKQALDAVLHLPPKDLITVNEIFHNMLTRGITVEYREKNRLKTETVRLLDFDNPEADHWWAVRRFVVETGVSRESLDMVIFVNGLPLVVMALEGDSEESRILGLRPLYTRLRRWQEMFPTIFRYNALSVVSDGRRARAGSLSAPYNRFTAWRSLGPESIAPVSINQLVLMVKGLLDRKVLTDVIRFFTLFERGKRKVKKTASYHQYYAVNIAAAAVRGVSVSGRRRGGVVWHTQGSGKSLTMLFYAAKLAALQSPRNPAIVIITDRNDLDDQLFETFSRARDLLRRVPVRAENRLHLRELLRRDSGGIIFTTIQKFFPGRGRTHPLLSPRNNIVVIVDEAHRSQYDFLDGFARHLADALPNASFTGFTGTPLEKEDRNTRAVFGDYIDVYDVQKSVEDGVTVPIYYEGRVKEIYGIRGERDRGRTAAVCRDLVEHFEQRRVVFPGKAMVAAASRSECIDLYREIVGLRPGWHDDSDFKGRIKAVITGTSSDPAEWQPHIRDKSRRRVIGDRLKNPADPLQMVIVCDMWLTGFDAPCLHTLYVDKPLKDHILVQAIARVNRVFRDKPGGLVVDYRGIAPQLKQALSVYMDTGAGGKPCFIKADAVARLEECHEELRRMLRGFDYMKYFKVPEALKESVLQDLREYILSLEKGEEVFIKKTIGLLKAFALSVPHPAALELKDTVTLFRMVKTRLTACAGRAPVPGSAARVETAVGQMMSTAVVTGDIVDILDAAGIKNTGLVVLSDELLNRLRGHPRPHIVAEFLARLLADEITALSRRNLVRGRAFMRRLRGTLSDYRGNRLTTPEVIDQLSRLTRELRSPGLLYKQKNLTADEAAVYDALTADENIACLWGDETAGTVARQLVEKIRRNAAIDWAVRETVRAKLRVAVKRTLRINGYPMENDGAPGIMDTLLKQVELLADAYSRES